MRRIHLTELICLCLVFVIPAVLNMTAWGEEKSLLQAKEANTNIATVEEIAENVTLISLDLARRIINYREENGGIEFLDELLDTDILLAEKEW